MEMLAGTLVTPLLSQLSVEMTFVPTGKLFVLTAKAVYFLPSISPFCLVATTKEQKMAPAKFTLGLTQTFRGTHEYLQKLISLNIGIGEDAIGIIICQTLHMIFQ